MAPTTIPFAENYPHPKEMSEDNIKLIIDQFSQAVKRSIDAGFEIIKLHFAHVYLVHEFYLTVSNQRKDRYGRTLENRCRFATDIAESLRELIPNDYNCLQEFHQQIGLKADGILTSLFN